MKDKRDVTPLPVGLHV